MDVRKPEEQSDGETDTSETTRVRQGISGQGVQYVLAFSLVGIVIAFIILAMFL